MQAAAVLLVVPLTKSTRLENRLRRDGVRQRYRVSVDAGHPSSGGGLSYHDGQLLPASDVSRYYETEIAGKPNGEIVKSPIFVIGTLSAGQVATVAKFLRASTAPSELRITGRSIKHADERRPDIVRALVSEFPLHFIENVVVLPNPQDDKKVLLVSKARRTASNKNYVAAVEVELRGDALYIASFMTMPDRTLRQAIELGANWQEGQQPPSGDSPHPVTPSGAHAEAGFSDVQPIGDLTIPDKFHKSMPSRLVVFSKESPMNQFDLLKSHIDAYTRKDGAVVQAHEDSRVAKQFNPGDKVHFPNPHKSDGSSAEGVYVGKREGRHVISHQGEEWEDDYPTLSDKPFGPKPKKEPYKPSDESKKMAAYHSKTADHHYSLAEKHKGNPDSNRHLKAAMAHDAASNSHMRGGGIARPSEMSDLAEQESKFANQAKK